MKVLLIMFLLFLTGCRDIPVTGEPSVSEMSTISTDREYDDTLSISGQIMEIKKKGDQTVLKMTYAEGEKGPEEMYAYGDMLDGFQVGDVTDIEYLSFEMTSKNRHFQRYEVYSIRKSDEYYDSAILLKDLITITPVRIGFHIAVDESEGEIEDEEDIAAFMERISGIAVYDRTYAKTSDDPLNLTEVVFTDAEDNRIVLKENNSVIIETAKGSDEYYYGFMQSHLIRDLVYEFLNAAGDSAE